MNLSYLMGGKDITDIDLQSCGVEVVGTSAGGNRKLKIPDDTRAAYVELVKAKLENGFWNEIVGETQILFIFKFKDGSIKEYTLSPQDEKEINDLCIEFNNEPPDMTPNVYKYISENEFYRQFMMEHYSAMINRA